MIKFSDVISPQQEINDAKEGYLKAMAAWKESSADVDKMTSMDTGMGKVTQENRSLDQLWRNVKNAERHLRRVLAKYNKTGILRTILVR